MFLLLRPRKQFYRGKVDTTWCYYLIVCYFSRHPDLEYRLLWYDLMAVLSMLIEDANLCIIRSERYSFSTVGSTSPKRMQIISTLPALSNAPPCRYFLSCWSSLPCVQQRNYIGDSFAGHMEGQLIGIDFGSVGTLVTANHEEVSLFQYFYLWWKYLGNILGNICFQ